MKKNIFICFLLFATLGFGQQLNQYKYAQVPSTFSFLNAKDEFRINTLAKMFMEKYQFITYFDTDVLPEEFANENCNKVYVDVLNKSNVFMTKLVVVLKDCKNNILFTSQEGKSREKQYAAAYNQALREAFASLETLEHVYEVQKSNQKETIAVAPKEEVKLEVKETSVEVVNPQLLVAETANGFDLFSSDHKLVLSAKKTSVKDVFIATTVTEKGILQKGKEGIWYFEYYREGSNQLVSEPMIFTY